MYVLRESPTPLPVIVGHCLSLLDRRAASHYCHYTRMKTAHGTRRHIFLTGLKHCGKTTLGKMLATRTGRRFYDLDDLLLDEARRDGYTSVRELYRTAGREKFQEYEALAAKKACFSLGSSDVSVSINSDLPSGSDVQGAEQRAELGAAGGTAKNTAVGSVFSLGGGTIENEGALPVIKSSGSLIYLHVAEEVLFERIRKNGLPPFLKGTQPAEELFHEIFLRRHPLYVEHADLILEVPNQAVEDNFELLYSYLKERNYVG